MTEVFEYAGRLWKLGYGLELVDPPKERWSDYETIIEALHPNITKWVWTREGSYQGDFFGLGKDDEDFYYFVSGSFGSCSGCDWLQAISNKDGAIEFLKHYHKVIIPQEGVYKMKKYLQFELINSYCREGIQEMLDKIDSLSETKIKEET